MENKDAKTTAEAIMKLFERNGTPQGILSDRGKEFLNKEIEAIRQKYRIAWSYSSADHHKTVGCVERVNQTLVRKLRKISNFDTENWEENLAKAVLATNISFHKAIGTSPYRLKYGKSYNVDIDSKYNLPETNYPIQNLIENRNKNFAKYAKKEIEKGQKSYTAQFKANDRVFIYKNEHSSKFAANWQDGYVIVQVLPHDSYIVTNGQHKFHLNKGYIKLDKKRMEEGDVSI